MTRLTATALRQDLYNLLDQVLETGEPIEIERKGRVLRIEADQPRSKLDNLVPDDSYIIGDPDDIVHMDWSSEWRP